MFAHVFTKCYEVTYSFSGGLEHYMRRQRI